MEGDRNSNGQQYTRQNSSTKESKIMLSQLGAREQDSGHNSSTKQIRSMLYELWLLTVAQHISQHDLLAVVVVCTCTRSCQPWSCTKIWLSKSTGSEQIQGCFGGVTTHRLILPVFGETLDQFDEACGLLTEMSGGAKVI